MDDTGEAAALVRMIGGQTLRWGGAGPTVVAYRFVGSQAEGEAGGVPDAATRAGIRLAMAYVETVADLRFVERADGALSIGARPEGSASTSLTHDAQGRIEAAELSLAPASGAYVPGTTAFASLLAGLHEALGLALPQTASGGLDPARLDGSKSVLARIDHAGTGHRDPAGSEPIAPSGPMLLDIAALQRLYGPATGTMVGDNRYEFTEVGTRLATIWDAGGTDTIDAGRTQGRVVIDLGEGRSSSIGRYGAGPGEAAERAVDNLTIARGSHIENAIGGRGNDRIQGNELANRLRGNAGDDVLEGGEGDDVLAGGIGRDVLAGGEGADIFAGTAAMLDGDSILDMGAGDLIRLESLRITDAQLFVDEAGERLSIDTDGDGEGDVTIRLEDGVEGDWSTSLAGRGDTLIAFTPAAPVPIPPVTPGAERPVLAYGTIEDLTHLPVMVDLPHTFERPVVLVQPASERGSDPVTVRLLEVDGDSFSVALQEPGNLDGIHYNGETVSWMVVEAGRWQLADGRTIEAGTIETDRLASSGFDDVAFAAAFADTPALFSQVQSHADSAWVTTRQDAAGRSGFRLAMQGSESGDAGTHGTETLGYLAVDKGRGEVGEDAGMVAGSLAAVDHDATTLDLPAGFGGTGNPMTLLAQIATMRDGDTANLRYRSDWVGHVSLRVQEDTTADAETAHAPEAVDYLAVTGSGVLSGRDVAPPPEPQVIAELGRLTTLTSTPQEVTFSHEFVDPVVVVGPVSMRGTDPVTVRLDALDGDGFTIRLDEAPGTDGRHYVAETASWMVVEAGSWALADGTRIEAGHFTTDAMAATGFEQVSFTGSFDAAPALMTQIQTSDDAEWVISRVKPPSERGFSYAMQEAEVATGGHGPETIGYVAMDRGTGSWDGHTFQAATTDALFDETATPLAFADVIDTTPNLLGQLASYYGKDPAVLRSDAVDADGALLRAQEETSLDAEILHQAEIVQFLAIEGEGLLTALPFEPPAVS